MNYYEDLSNRDIIGKLRPYFDQGKFYMRDDGKVTWDTRLTHNTPWIHWKQAPNRNCGHYHVFYNAFGFIHSRCQECWKVVARPRTLKELETVMVLQKAIDRPSKCGIERRETVCGLYGAYWYNDSIEEGKECYRIVRDAIDQAVSPNVTIVLKRACTEFEIDGKFGSSDTWEVSDDQKVLEERLNDIMVGDVKKMPQPDHLKDSVFRTWIHWAYQNGDLTYLEYTNGEPLFRPYKTYHEVCDGEEDKVGSSKWKTQ